MESIWLPVHHLFSLPDQIELNLKNRRVQECESIIETLRRNLRDSQLMSEQLSQNLYKEEQHRQQVNTKWVVECQIKI